MHRSFDDLGADLFSHDGLDLIAAGLGPDEEEEELGGDYTNMDSLDFYLWMEEEVDKEAARRAARKVKKQISEK